MKLRMVSLLSPGGDEGRDKVTRAVSTRTTRSVKFDRKATWQERHDQLDTGKAKAGELCGLLYTVKKDDGAPLEPLVAPVPEGERYGGKPVYYSDVIVAADSPFQSF